MNVLNRINEPNDIKKLSLNEQNELAKEIRELLLNTISKNGGHLASNLGVVELTIALLNNYDFTKDKIVFDVGHQSYVYKILTDRKNLFNTIRTHKGISGFPKREESKYDFFDTGHSSNSISAALGMARARDLKKEDHNIIALIGDGAFTGGMVYEALNDLGYNHSKMLIILNDNQMSISSNVGGLSNYLNKVKLNPSYNKIKKSMHHKLSREKSSKIIKLIRRFKNSIKTFFFNPMFFENLGVRYIGPIDGNNVTDLNRVINKVKKLDGPIVLHVITTKGIGYAPALEKPDKFHAISKFDITTGATKTNTKKTYSDAFGEALVKLAERNPDIVAISAAMINGTGLKKFSEIYPDRTFDVGITEEHAVTLAAGMATSGLRPVFAVYSTFLARGFDQLLIDVCMQNLPVVFGIDRAGLVGNDGKTHQGVFDLSYLNLMPNIKILSPKCTSELPILLDYALKENGPVAIRYPRGGDDLELNPLKKVKTGVWEKIDAGEKVIVLATGKMVENAIKAKAMLKKYNPIIVNATFIKPLDQKCLKEIVAKNYNVLTIEDNNIIGGFGEQVLYHLNLLNFKGKIKIMGYSDKFIDHGSVEELLLEEKLDIKSIAKEIEKLYK